MQNDAKSFPSEALRVFQEWERALVPRETSAGRPGSDAKSRLSTSATAADSACRLLPPPARRAATNRARIRKWSLQAGRTPQPSWTLRRGQVPGGQGSLAAVLVLSPSTAARALTYCVTATCLADKRRAGRRGQRAAPPPAGLSPQPGRGCSCTRRAGKPGVDGSAAHLLLLPAAVVLPASGGI